MSFMQKAPQKLPIPLTEVLYHILFMIYAQRWYSPSLICGKFPQKAGGSELGMVVNSVNKSVMLPKQDGERSVLAVA